MNVLKQMNIFFEDENPILRLWACCQTFYRFTANKLLNGLSEIIRVDNESYKVIAFRSMNVNAILSQVTLTCSKSMMNIPK